jgi:hypothetical protein
MRRASLKVVVPVVESLPVVGGNGGGLVQGRHRENSAVVCRGLDAMRRHYFGPPA